MKQIKTSINQQATKEFVQGSFYLAIVGFGVALAMIALYIVLGIINHAWADPLQIVLVIVGGLLLIVSIGMVIGYINSLNKVKDLNRTIVYNFSDDEITYDIYRNEEKVDSGKASYLEITEYKETKHFVYLRLVNNTWLILSKEEELLDFINTKGIRKHGLSARR